MEMMGSKTRARQNMKKAGVPFVPGSEKGLEFDGIERMAEQIGYPVMLKAAAGGGGKGMRMVSSHANLRSSYDAARSEAQRSFGDNEVYIEKFIVNPRHVELQVFGDEYGNVVYLGERECSIQRRGHGGIPGRRATQLLFPRDEHPTTGGASGDGIRNRLRPCASAVSRG
jgi:acetyl-CoA carboxylase biotin carboxylase subunit